MRNVYLYIGMADIVMAYIPMACIGMADIVMAYISMAYIGMEDIVMAYTPILYRYGRHSYGRHSYGLRRHDRHSYGLHTLWAMQFMAYAALAYHKWQRVKSIASVNTNSSM